jgi:hemolysin-activating ACP:hemolysin acyltransferase
MNGMLKSNVALMTPAPAEARMDSDQGRRLQTADDFGSIVAGILELLMASPMHRRWSLEAFDRLIVTPMKLRQAIILRVEGKMRAFCSWALVSEAVFEDLRLDRRKMDIPDWRSGPILMLTDVIAPYGDAKRVTSALKRVMPDYTGPIRAVRRNPDGTIRRCVDLTRS